MQSPTSPNISTCLWFDGSAAEAVAFYTSVIPNSQILETQYYLEGAPLPAGSVLIIRFTLDGVEYMALNGTPAIPFSPAVSLVAYCDTQAEIDTLWQKLGEDGQEVQCGWLTDKYGLSWQIVPRPFIAMLNGENKVAAQRAFSAMMGMIKLDIAALQSAYDGE